MNDYREIKISILIPVYNSEKYIERCLNSILNQTFKAYEVILIDDGSTDESAGVIQKIVETDARFRYMVFEHQGVSACRQKALEHAKGDYTIFLDSDDWIEDNMLEEMYHCCITHMVDGVCAGIIKDDLNKTQAFLPVEEECVLDALELLKLFYNRKFVATLTCYLINRRLWSEFQFNPEISVGEDMQGLVHILTAADRIYAINKAYYHYCQNGDSIVHSNLTEGKINAYYFEKRMQNIVLELIPDCEEAIKTWYIQNEIYLLSAMGRSNQYIKEISTEITGHCRRELKLCRGSKFLETPYKISAVLVSINGYLYYKIYMIVYKYLRRVYCKISGNRTT